MSAEQRDERRISPTETRPDSWHNQRGVLRPRILVIPRLESRPLRANANVCRAYRLHARRFVSCRRMGVVAGTLRQRPRMRAPSQHRSGAAVDADCPARRGEMGGSSTLSGGDKRSGESAIAFADPLDRGPAALVVPSAEARAVLRGHRQPWSERRLEHGKERTEVSHQPSARLTTSAHRPRPHPRQKAWRRLPLRETASAQGGGRRRIRPKTLSAVPETRAALWHAADPAAAHNQSDSTQTATAHCATGVFTASRIYGRAGTRCLAAPRRRHCKDGSVLCARRRSGGRQGTPGAFVVLCQTRGLGCCSMHDAAWMMG
jgi:hypothetical protein